MFTVMMSITSSYHRRVDARREITEQFCRSVISGRNKNACDIIKEYKHSISRVNIKVMDFKRETFSRDLTNMFCLLSEELICHTS